MEWHIIPMAQDALEPCPLCGSAPRENSRAGAFGFLCDGPGEGVGKLHRVQAYGATREEAIAAWNTRTLPPIAQEDPMREAADIAEAMAVACDTLAVSTKYDAQDRERWAAVSSDARYICRALSRARGETSNGA